MALIELFLLAAQAQQASPPIASPSPEVLRALTDLMNALATPPTRGNTAFWSTPDGLKAVASFIVAIAWPLLAAVAIFKFRSELAAFLSRMNKVDLLGFKAEWQMEVRESGEKAGSLVGLSKAPSADELERARKVEVMAREVAPHLIRQQIDALATEYDVVRGSMPPSGNRTSRMEVVLSKMRTIGRIAYGMRYELIHSPSPGRRLQAVASLQVIPDYELVDWLAECIRTEKPFIQYHAVRALIVAARGEHANHYIDELENALKKAKENIQGLPTDSDRAQAFAEFEENVSMLHSSLNARTSTPNKSHKASL